MGRIETKRADPFTLVSIHSLRSYSTAVLYLSNLAKLTLHYTSERVGNFAGLKIGASHGVTAELSAAFMGIKH